MSHCQHLPPPATEAIRSSMRMSTSYCRAYKFCQQLVVLFLLTLPVTHAHAHPHNYVQVEATISINAGAVQGLLYVWRFDSKYVEGLKEEYDANHDGILSDEELLAWLAASKSNLETFKYFTTLRQAQETVPVGNAEGYRVERPADGLALHFTVRPTKAIDMKSGPLQVDIYDRTFFTEFVLGDGRGVTVEATATSGTCLATVALAPGGEQQKAITTFMKMFGRVDAKLAPAKAITVTCKG